MLRYHVRCRELLRFPVIYPCLSHAVCASYANCLLWSPFTKSPLSGSVTLWVTVFIFLRRANFFFDVFLFGFEGLGGSLLLSSSSKGFLPCSSRSALTSSIGYFAYLFDATGTSACIFFLLFAFALMCVPSMKTAVGDRYPASAISFKIQANI